MGNIAPTSPGFSVNLKAKFFFQILVLYEFFDRVNSVYRVYFYIFFFL